MTWEHIKADWERYSAHMRDRWGRLTDDDLVLAQAGRNALVGCVQSRYQVDRALAERHVDQWITSLG
ncbi:MAG TPA: hypothetical protein VJ748_09225 [Vitreimonas sp.]|jgi:uncharacterized protein YjbJ (UPF0337 family)|nr:hypothetical protein [Vitreimonas sp.]